MQDIEGGPGNNSWVTKWVQSTQCMILQCRKLAPMPCDTNSIFEGVHFHHTLLCYVTN